MKLKVNGVVNCHVTCSLGWQVTGAMVSHISKFEGPATVWHLEPEERKAFMNRVRRSDRATTRRRLAGASGRRGRHGANWSRSCHGADWRHLMLFAGKHSGRGEAMLFRPANHESVCRERAA